MFVWRRLERQATRAWPCWAYLPISTKSGATLERSTVKDAKWLENKFSRVEHALALSHRVKAAEAWGRKAYDEAGYELKAAAHGLENAARWSGNEGPRTSLQTPSLGLARWATN